MTDEFDYSTNTKTTYYYDSLGNICAAVRFSFTIDSNGAYNYSFVKSESYSYDDTNRPDKLTYNSAFGSVEYDALGNPTSLKGYTLNWQNGRQLGSISKGGKTTSYYYNSDGLRTKRIVDGVDYDYTWRDGVLVHQTQGSNEFHFYYDSTGSIVGFTLNGGAYTYLKNLQGDVIGIVDGSGNTVASYSYDAWGNVTSQSGTLAEINPRRYKGYYYDSDTGMYYLQSRYYDPSLRRFINADDPNLIEDLAKTSVLGANLFSYCENNPLINSDHNGNISFQSIIKILGYMLTMLVLGTMDYFLLVLSFANPNKIRKGIVFTAIYLARIVVAIAVAKYTIKHKKYKKGSSKYLLVCFDAIMTGVSCIFSIVSAWLGIRLKIKAKLNDWAMLLYRISQVFGLQTSIIGLSSTWVQMKSKPQNVSVRK